MAANCPRPPEATNGKFAQSAKRHVIQLDHAGRDDWIAVGRRADRHRSEMTFYSFQPGLNGIVEFRQV